MTWERNVPAANESTISRGNGGPHVCGPYGRGVFRHSADQRPGAVAHPLPRRGRVCPARFHRRSAFALRPKFLAKEN
jgi:hypothetical protein